MKKQLLGYTINDSLKFEQSIRSVMKIPKDKGLFSSFVGEHQNTQVLLFSQILINENPIVFDDYEQAAIKERVSREFIQDWELSSTGRVGHRKPTETTRKLITPFINGE